MDDGQAAPPPAKSRRRRKKKTAKKKNPHMPHELVSEILARLPVQSLLRLTRVCRAWRDTISSDASFDRAHHCLQKQCLLVSPRWRFGPEPYLCCPKTVGLYRREAGQEDTDAPLVVYATILSPSDTVHGFAHCDGLVLVPHDATVHVINPAKRRAVRLPTSPNLDLPRQYPDRFTALSGSHQAFGFGHDPRSNTHKVARFFYRSAVSGGSYTTGMEVFTVGVDRYWLEMAAQPQYPIVPQQTATFFKGSLLWTISDEILKDVAPCFLRFGLEDEEFVVTPLPPYHPTSNKTMTSFLALRGELVIARVGATVEMWMCHDINNPRWDLRYKVSAPTCGLASLSPIAVFDGDIVFKDEVLCCLISYDLQTKAAKDVVRMKELRYHNPNTGAVELEHLRKHFSSFDVISYVPSLIPV